MNPSLSPEFSKPTLREGAGAMPALGFGTLIPDAAMTSRDRLGSLMSTSVSVTRRLRFNPAKIRIHAMKTATSFTIAA